MDWRESRAGKRWLALYGHRKKVRMTWLARARLLSGQSVAQAATACGLSPRTWEAWERVGDARKEPDPAQATIVATTIPLPLGAHNLYALPYVTVDPSTLKVVP